MTTVQTSYVQPGGYPPQQGYPSAGHPQQQGYPSAGHPQTGYPSQQPLFIQIQQPPQATTTTNAANNPSRYNKTAARVTGSLQICGGTIMLLLGIVAIVLGTVYPLGWSIWGSICFYIVAGILGVVSQNQNKCVIVANMVMSIIAAVCAGGQMINESFAAAVNPGYACYYYNDLDCANITYAQPAPAGQAVMGTPGSYPAPGLVPGNPAQGPSAPVQDKPPAYTPLQPAPRQDDTNSYMEIIP